MCSRGRCRYCRASISFQYPLVEAINGFLYVLFYIKYGIGLLFIKYCIIASVLVVISFIDYKFFVIPDKINIFLCVISLFMDIYMKISVVDMIFGFVFGFGFFYLLSILSKGNMGGGDIKLMGALGVCLGFTNIVAITFISFVVGAIVSLLLIIARIKSKKDAIAFGPFIAIAAIIIMHSGNEMINYYLNIY